MADTKKPGALAKTEIKRKFATKLYDEIAAKGWNQNDFARRVQAHLRTKDPDARFSRDNVSTYVRGRAMPLPANLNAMAEILGLKPDELLPKSPRAPGREAGPPLLEFIDLGDGTMSVRINRTFDKAAAMKLMRVVTEVEFDEFEKKGWR